MFKFHHRASLKNYDLFRAKFDWTADFDQANFVRVSSSSCFLWWLSGSLVKLPIVNAKFNLLDWISAGKSNIAAQSSIRLHRWCRACCMTQSDRFACCINDQLLFRCLSFSLFAGNFHASLLQKVDSQETSGHKSRTPSPACAASAAACIRRPQVTQSDGVTSQWQPSQLSRSMARSTSSSTTSYDSSGGPAQQPQLKRWKSTILAWTIAAAPAQQSVAHC